MLPSKVIQLGKELVLALDFANDQNVFGLSLIDSSTRVI